MSEFYIVIDQDDDRDLVYKPTQHSYILDHWADMQPFPKWTFEKANDQITVVSEYIILHFVPLTSSYVFRENDMVPELK